MKRLFGPSKEKSAQGNRIGGGVALQTTPVASDGIRGLSCLYSPQKTEVTHVRDILDELFDSGKINEEQKAQVRQDKSLRRSSDMQQHLIDNNIVSEKDVLMASAALSGYRFRELKTEDVSREAFDMLGYDYIKQSLVMPVEIHGETLVIAMSEPNNVFAIDDVKRQTGMKVEIVVSSMQNIKEVCDEFSEGSYGYDVDELINDIADIEVVQETEVEAEDLEKSAGESPVIKLVNLLLTGAVREKASDIHIEPKEKYSKVRYRIDGVLFESRKIPAKMHPAIVSRIKIMANLDISERRIPQDGKIAVLMGGRGIDLRISTLPTSHGEKVVIRILDSKSIMKGLDNCGMEQDVLELFRSQVQLPHGILLVTGPTGSGKSTTLYSALGQMDSTTLNISTVEDPVEYDLETCNQVQANEKVGLTFASALRSLLRQDPDIIMVGEIRDGETARIAVQAALTGHLVLSTLHTNDAPSTISRLVNIGIEPYLIASSLNGVLAQRLVRRICPNCKENYTIPEHLHKYIHAAGGDPAQLVHGAGCSQCRQSGYQGRAGIFEFLVIDDNFRELINRDSSGDAMRTAFAASEYNSLFDDGIEKVKQGITTIEEVLRVTEASEVCQQNNEQQQVETTVRVQDD